MLTVIARKSLSHLSKTGRYFSCGFRRKSPHRTSRLSDLQSRRTILYGVITPKRVQDCSRLVRWGLQTWIWVRKPGIRDAWGERWWGGIRWRWRWGWGRNNPRLGKDGWESQRSWNESPGRSGSYKTQWRKDSLENLQRINPWKKWQSRDGLESTKSDNSQQAWEAFIDKITCINVTERSSDAFIARLGD